MLTFAALFSNASVAVNSVAGDNVDFALATANVNPTIIVASSNSIAALHRKSIATQKGSKVAVGRWTQQRALAAGYMPSPSWLLDHKSIGPGNGSRKQPRLIYVSYRAAAEDSTRLSSAILSDLRTFTGARLMYALTVAKVAGAVCQTNIYDYRQSEGLSHFGPPLGSVEIKLVDATPVPGADQAMLEGEVNQFSSANTLANADRYLSRARPW